MSIEPKAKRKAGRPPFAAHLRRIRIWSGGPHVKRETKLAMELWRAQTGLSLGSLLDIIVDYAAKGVPGPKWDAKMSRKNLKCAPESIIQAYEAPEGANTQP